LKVQAGNSMKTDVCIECKEKPVFVKIRRLCQFCAQKFYREHGPILKGNPDAEFKNPKTDKQNQHGREVVFIRNFFDHNDWVYHPALFRFNGEKYSPDFYDGKRNIFIEVSGSRQAYHSNKDKYNLFKKIFPKINFEIRKHDGTLLDETNGRIEWQPSNNLPSQKNIAEQAGVSDSCVSQIINGKKRPSWALAKSLPK